jgi:hypothetical protein
MDRLGDGDAVDGGVEVTVAVHGGAQPDGGRAGGVRGMLQGFDLTGVTLTGANLTNANLAAGNLLGANPTGAGGTGVADAPSTKRQDPYTCANSSAARSSVCRQAFDRGDTEQYGRASTKFPQAGNSSRGRGHGGVPFAWCAVRIARRGGSSSGTAPR